MSAFPSTSFAPDQLESGRITPFAPPAEDMLGLPGSIVFSDGNRQRAFRNVFILVLLRIGKVVAFVEESGKVPLICGPIARHNQADATSCNITESGVESHEIAATNHVDPLP